jgi:hypothetical protein
MEHLSIEELARLVDERPDAGEAAHLAACGVCADELEQLRGQTSELRSLPEIMPPQGDWQVLEAQLRSEGLVKDPPLLERLGLARTPPWMKVAAAALLFISGTGAGAAVTYASTSPAARSNDTIGGTVAHDEVRNVDDAASAVRTAEEQYVSAVVRYRELLAEQGIDDSGSDPISRFAALEHLVAVSQAAVRQAPGDPFLNGFLASAVAERDAALRTVSANRDNWF